MIMMTGFAINPSIAQQIVDAIYDARANLRDIWKFPEVEVLVGKEVASELLVCGMRSGKVNPFTYSFSKIPPIMGHNVILSDKLEDDEYEIHLIVDKRRFTR